jgi:hypothetical protein
VARLNLGGWRGQRTSRYFVTDFCWEPFVQVTVTGQLPAVVREPTFHVQEAIPLLFAVLGPSPAAFEGPDLYSTTIVQEAPALVRTVAVAFDPGETGEVSELNVSARLGGGVGFGVGRGVGLGVGAGVGFGVGLGVGAGVAAGDGLGWGGVVPNGLAPAVAPEGGDAEGGDAGGGTTTTARDVAVGRGLELAAAVAPVVEPPDEPRFPITPITTRTATTIVIFWMRDACPQAWASQLIKPPLPND